MNADAPRPLDVTHEIRYQLVQHDEEGKPTKTQWFTEWRKLKDSLPGLVDPKKISGLVIRVVPVRLEVFPNYIDDPDGIPEPASPVPTPSWPPESYHDFWGEHFGH